MNIASVLTEKFGNRIIKIGGREIEVYKISIEDDFICFETPSVKEEIIMDMASDIEILSDILEYEEEGS